MSTQQHPQSQPASHRTQVPGKAINTSLGIVQEHMRRIEQHDFDGAGSLLSLDFQFTGVTPTPVKREEYVKLHRELLGGLHDWKYNFRLEREDGNVVRGSVRVTGTHTGTIAPTFIPGINPITPTGKQVKLPEEPLTITVHNGLIINIDVKPMPNGGVLGILSQLGVNVPH